MSSTVDKALSLLKLVAGHEEPMGLLQVSALAGLDKSTALRLLAVLCKHGLLSRDTHKKYRIGPDLFRLSAGFVQRHEIRRLALSHLSRIRDATRETVSLHLLIDDARVCVEGVESPEAIRRGVRLGEVQPLHEGPTGKVILAFLRDPEREALLSRIGLPPRRRADLDQQLQLIGEEGYLAVSDDRVLGLSGLSAPVFDNSGVVGSITVAGPKERWTVKRMRAYAPQFLSEVKALIHQLKGGADGTLAA